ncbi:hypothetical protein CFN78_27965 [Amycolatopsis antarctica]|uniref:Uncharacterized protein n=1 Tax=Amycolatopsis antarctica TaxID=1854586 RepID=A0A263CUY0_9PSEU|nr:hypothetical protein [Amycolatopsis antarctica]OZM69932.1 hypothetical protein CFN78_27965 [Amycolatopsis antarctica]
MKNFTIIGNPGTALSCATEVAMTALPGIGMSSAAPRYAELPVFTTTRERALVNAVNAVSATEAVRPTVVPVTADLLIEQAHGPSPSPPERST